MNSAEREGRMETNLCCEDGKCITINTVNTLNVTCCCKCECNGGGDKPEPPTPEEPEKKYKTMTVKVDLSNSDPATCCSYADDAVDMVPGSAEWDKFFGHYPVLFKDGKEVGKLNPNDFTKFEDGTAADITSGVAGDVMTAFPRRGLKIDTVGDIMTVSMTDDPDAVGFEYLAHVRGDQRRDVFYLGAYKGFKDATNKLRSLSGKMPTGSQAMGTFRSQAQSNGAGYEQSAFYQLTFRQAMYLLKYANLNSQIVVGRGYVDGSAAQATGLTNTKGMDCGEVSGLTRMKLFGIEDSWGNVWEWIDGFIMDSLRNILIAMTGFNDTGSGYRNYGKNKSEDVEGFLSKPQGTSEVGFLMKETKATETTGFCDYTNIGVGQAPLAGGAWNNESTAGIFRLTTLYSASFTDASTGARLMYL